MPFKIQSFCPLLFGTLFGMSLACSPAVPRPVFKGSANSVPATCEGSKCPTKDDDPEEETPAADDETDPVVVSDPDKDPDTVKPPVSNLPATFTPAVTSLTVSNEAGSALLKGDSATIKLTFKNAGSKEGSIKVSPILTSKRFSDFKNVRLPTVDLKVLGGETKVASLIIPTFFKDVSNNKEFALNRGSYSLAFDIEPEGGTKKTESALTGRDFEVGKSNVVFTAVFWEQAYFDKTKYTGGVEKYLAETFTRKGEILTPTQTDGSTGNFKSFPKGFDEMMAVKTVFKTFDGFSLDTKADFSGTGILHQVEAFGKKRLGLLKDFQGTGCDRLTHEDNHGFDMAIGMSHEGFGGIAWVCGNTQASGVFDGDPSIGRSQMVLIHETGHNFGAPHCDPIQGFIMCSGEKHEHYAQSGQFVWHSNSIRDMQKKEQGSITNNYLNLTAFPSESVSEPVLAVCDGTH
ncbi:MAG: hypothetical protein EOP07_09215 [Proteobacteria bacterium]|nr:MAG: hypothetical protein EOP07_09215 [Pseudomonadota bacterium]